MKYIIFLLVIISTACNNDKYSPDFSNGKATAMSEGKKWVGEVRGGIDTRDSTYFTLQFTHKNVLGEARQSIGIEFIPRTIGNYSLKYRRDTDGDTIPFGLLTLLSSDGDAVYGFYVPVKDPEKCFVNVTEFNHVTRWVRGTFNVVFIEDPVFGKMFPDNPDTIRFENGVFDVRLEE